MTVHLHIQSFSPRRLARWFLLTLGIACLGIYAAVFLQRELYQAYESWQFDREPHADAANASLVPEQSGGHTLPAHRMGVPARNAGRQSVRLGENALIGRLSVQRLHLTAMVREGVDNRTLRLAVGHIPSTALPGQAGNVGVAGHRDTFFRGLKDLQTKDEILFSTASGDYRYIVDSLLIVEPDNVAVLATSAGNVLTLVTCYPFSYVGNAPKRFIVRARQVWPPMAPPVIVE